MYYNKVEICGVNTSRLPTLTSAEKKELLRRTRDGDSGAREELIDGNLRLVLSILQRFTNRHENLDDLFQVGCIGLIKAIDHFNPDIEVELSTYAVPMICESRNNRKEHIVTRKQALLAAMQILSTNPEYVEISKLLQDIYDDLPLLHWNEKSIHDSVQQFILEHGRVPTATDFDRPGLPTHTVIKRKYHVNLAEWLKQNYPTATLTFDEKAAPYIREFIEDYNRIQPKTQQEFEKQRREGVVCYQTIMKYCHAKTWGEVIKILNLPDYRCSTRASRHIAAKVNVHCDLKMPK